MNKIIEQEPRQIVEVQETVNEIFNSFDKKEWKKCRALFCDEVEINVLSPNGNKSAKYYADDLISKWEKSLHKKRKSYRHLGKQSVVINDGIASVSSRSYIFHRLENSDQQEFWEIWGDYTHYLVKTENGWKCSKIRLAIPSQSENFDVNIFIPENEIKK